jgi:capsular exopolysaccharide synthesis family protein
VSRIDQALQRAKLESGSAPAVSDQSSFQPAWHRETEPASEPVPEDRMGWLAVDAHRAPETHAVVSFSSEWRERLASAPGGHPALIEQFRRLAATLHHAQSANGLRSVMITSAMPGDGKTLTAVNLALVLAESYRARVLLVDADLRRPSIPSVVDLGEGGGLSEALVAQTEQKLALVALTPRLTLLPAGQPIANSIDALTSPRMRQILDEAKTRYEWVILDAPPVGPTADAGLLTDMVDGTLFVIHAGQTQYADIQKGIDVIGRDHILGVVLNGTELQPFEGYYGHDRLSPKG